MLSDVIHLRHYAMIGARLSDLSTIQVVSLLAAILTILAFGIKGVLITKREWAKLQRILQMALREKLTENALRPLWGPLMRGGCTLVLPTKDPARVEEQPEWVRTMFLDYLGAAHLMQELNIAFDTMNVSWVQSDNVSQPERSKNLISVGGPQPNQITATILRQPEVIYRFPESTDSDSPGNYIGKITSQKSSEKVFESKKEGENVVRDVGIITKIRNPYNRDEDAIAACGVWGWGVKAGFELLTDEDTLDYLIKEGGEYFQAIYTVDIDEHNQTTEPYLLDLHPDEQLREKTIVPISYDESH